MMRDLITAVCGREAPEVMEHPARARVWLLELSSSLCMLAMLCRLLSNKWFSTETGGFLNAIALIRLSVLDKFVRLRKWATDWLISSYMGIFSMPTFVFISREIYVWGDTYLVGSVTNSTVLQQMKTQVRRTPPIFMYLVLFPLSPCLYPSSLFRWLWMVVIVWPTPAAVVFPLSFRLWLTQLRSPFFYSVLLCFCFHYSRCLF